MQNEAIIIGNDHVNTLGVVRALGEHGIFPIVYIIDNSNFISISKSKYIKKVYVFSDEKEAIDDIKKRFSNTALKPVLIPTSDKAASAIDYDYDNISKICFTQNIDNKNNLINKYMDKYEQYKTAKECNINVAKSLTIDLPFNSSINFDMPVIIKPIVSAKGNKMDIKICKTEDEFYKYLDLLYKYSYKKVLVQEFLDYDYEYEIVGFSFDNKISLPICVKKIRIWPKDKGSTTFGQVLSINDIGSMEYDIKKIIQKIGYFGIFDVEVFKKGNKFYFNEINFRNGGHSYAYRTHNMCYYWYLSIINNKFIIPSKFEDDYYFIDEQADFHNVIERKITFSQYLKDKKNSKILLNYNKDDKKPSYIMIIKKIFNRINKFNFMKKIYHVCNQVSIYKYDKGTNFNDTSNYTFKKIDKSNYKSIAFDKRDERYFKKIVNSPKYYCLGLVIDDKIIGRGVIEFYKANDYYIKIVNKNSVLFSSLYVHSQYRGNGYQRLLFNKMIEISNKILKNPDIYAVVNPNNIPSKKNILKSGFKEVDNVKIKRFMGISLNKYKI